MDQVTRLQMLVLCDMIFILDAKLKTIYQITYEDGELVELQRRERPHLIFDDRGFITHITNGVQPPPSKIKHPPSNAYQNDFTYTLVQPVEKQP